MTIGLFKGTMRVTSSFPNSRDSWQTYRLLETYLDFILSINDHSSCLVFTDEKPTKVVLIYGKVRIYMNNGTTSAHKFISINSKSMFNILTAINIKGQNIRHVEYVILG